MSITTHGLVRQALHEAIEIGTQRFIADALNIAHRYGLGIPEPRDEHDLACYEHMSMQPDVIFECRRTLAAICVAYVGGP